MVYDEDAVTECKKDLKESNWKRGLRKSDADVKEAELVSLGYVGAMEEKRLLLGKRLDRIEEEGDRRQELQVSLATLEKTVVRDVPTSPTLKNVQPSLDKVDGIVRLSKLKVYKVPPSPSLTAPAKALKAVEAIQTYHRFEEEAEQAKADWMETKVDVLNAETWKEKLETELKVCPTCGKAFHGV